MAITQESFDRLVARLESDIKASPRLYAVRVFLLALLGYAYPIFIMGAISLFCSMYLIMRTGSDFLLIKLLGPLPIFALPILRAFWIKTGPPKGYEIGPRQAAPLFR